MHTSVSTGGLSVSDGIARLIIIALFAFVPFFIIPTAWASVAQGKMLLVGSLILLALISWFIARMMEGVIQVPRSALLYSAALLPIAYLLSALVSGNGLAAIVGQGVEQDTLAAIFVWFSLAALAALLLHSHAAALRLSLQSFVFGITLLLAFQALYTLMPTVFSIGGLLVGDTANLLGSWHDLGIVAGLGLFFAVLSIPLNLFTGWQRMIPAILALASLFLLIVIHFSDVFFATAGLFFISALVLIRTGIVHSGISYVSSLRTAAPLLIVAVALGAAGFVGANIWEKLPEKINVVQAEVRPSWQGTFDTARQSLEAPTDFVFGSGPNSFVREWGKNKPTDVNLTPFWNADFTYGVGIIPTSIFAAGLFGLVAWGALILCLLGLAYTYVREPRPLSSHHLVLGVAQLTVVYLLAYHFIYTPSNAITALLFLAIGFLVAAESRDHSLHSWRLGFEDVPSVLRLFAVVVFALAAVLAAGFIAREVVSNLLVNRAAYLYQTNRDIKAAGENLSTALMVSPQNDRAHRAAAELGVVRLAELIQANSADAAARTELQETLQRTIQHGLTAVSINEGNYQNWLLLAQIYGDLAGVNIDGSLEAAKNAYEKAFEASPKNPVPKLRLAQLAAAAGNRAAARGYVEEAIALKQDFAAAYYLLSQIEAADGNGDAAVAAASTAVQLIPDDPLGWFNLGSIFYAAQSYQNAAQAFQAALQRAPDYSNALFYLGLSAYELGDPNAAAQIFDRVVALNPNEAWVAQMSANVRAGKAPMDGIQSINQ